MKAVGILFVTFYKYNIFYFLRWCSVAFIISEILIENLWGQGGKQTQKVKNSQLNYYIAYQICEIVLLTFLM